MRSKADIYDICIRYLGWQYNYPGGSLDAEEEVKKMTWKERMALAKEVCELVCSEPFEVAI